MRNKNVFFSFIAALVISTSAFAQRGPIDRYPDRRPDMERGREQTITRRIDRSFTRQSQLDLTRFLGSRYYGSNIHSIQVDAYAERGAGRADINLIINRQYEDSRPLGMNGRRIE